MEERKLNPSQAETYISLVREIRSHLASGKIAYESGVYKTIRTRARELEPVKKEIIQALCAAVKNGTFTLSEAKAIITHLFGKKETDAFKALQLTRVELAVMLDLEFEARLQIDRRNVDDSIIRTWNANHQPEALKSKRQNLQEEEAYWLGVLSDINSDLHPLVSMVIEVRGDADSLEAKKEFLLNEVAGLNSQIRHLKSKARKAKDEEVIVLADEICLLAKERDEFRRQISKCEEKLAEINYSLLRSTEQFLEHQSEQAISALEQILDEADEVDDLLLNPPADVEVSETDEVGVLADAHVNVVRRIRDRIAGQPKYKREFLEKLAERIEDEAYILEV